MRVRLFLPILFLTACGPGVPAPFDPPDPPSVDPEPPDAGPASVDDPGGDPLAGFACATEERCARSGPFLPETCCARGDALQAIAVGTGSETVGLAVDGDRVIACGGFGAHVSVDDGEHLERIGIVGQRCQHAAFGERRADGSQVFYLTHHGDTWVTWPRVTVGEIDADGTARLVSDVPEEDGPSLGGVAWHDGALYVAAHGEGLRVYDAVGTAITLLDTQPLGTVRELAVAGSHLYALVDDALVVLDVDEPTAPVELARVATRPGPRHVAVRDGLAVVSQGTAGLDLFDVTDPAAPSERVQVDLAGSAQAAAVTDHAVVVAAWDHVVAIDRETHVVLATERTRTWPEVEQDLAIGASGDRVYVGEWVGTHVLELHEGLVAPELWTDATLVSFDANKTSRRELEVENRGPLPLTINATAASDPTFGVSAGPITLPPWGRATLELVHEPPALSPSATLTLTSDDPDRVVSEVGLYAAAGDALDEGDELPEAFAFLAPDEPFPASMEGEVWLLAYFALF